MSTIRVGVVRGGPSDEYDVSLKSGAAVLSSLAHAKFDGKYAPKDILISKEGVWHIAGMPVLPEQAFGQIDIFVNALHGAYGEDGTFQSLLERYGAVYTGSTSLPSALGMNKALTKKIFKQHGIRTPRHIVVEEGELAGSVGRVFSSFSLPIVVKPASGGSSIGVSVVSRFPDLEQAVRTAMERSKTGAVLVEEFISGKEATVGVIDRFRGEALYALPAVEIRHGRDFFDYETKYSDAASGGTGEIVPGSFTPEEKAALCSIARDIHTALGLRHYSRSDFIVSPRRGIYALEVNTLPGLTPASLLPKALASVGASLPNFLDHIIALALEEK